ncbi:hypothetical protein [Alkaliphilus transvaalensis]|uniref:hypothetical protein n=1 Tax=Alkaliphilus transvaalensis TaxID=114628 RepID=UPI00047E1686|nr:hypothetical protein [Alkaliphilus transvaalensis]
MKKSTTVIHFINDISFLIDKGTCYSIDEVNEHLEKKDVIDWLEAEFPFGSDNGIDFSMFGVAERKFLHDELESFWSAYVGQENRKWGIENNGLCILIGWSLGILQDIIRDKNDEML